MLQIFQKTLLKPIKFSGIGLHSGNISNVRLVPTSENHGIKFKRTDLKTDNIIEANYKNVCSANLCTTVSNKNGVKVSTIEHLLAALYFTGVNNLLVEIDSEEIPILDGSAIKFFEIIQNAGTQSLTAKNKYLQVKNKIEIKDKHKSISLEPNDDGMIVDFNLVYKNKLIGNQRNSLNINKDDLTDIINARTFCLHEDIEMIKKSGLAKGGSLQNAIVVKDNEILNHEGLRNEKEFVNHKILDLVGDFLLSGYQILGKIVCDQGGHSLTNTFLRDVFDNPVNISNLEVIELEKPKNKEYKITSPLRVAASA